MMPHCFYIMRSTSHSNTHLSLFLPGPTSVQTANISGHTKALTGASHAALFGGLFMLFMLPTASAGLLFVGNYAGHDYWYDSSGYTSIQEANSAALANHLALASITSQDENQFLVNAIGPIAASELRTSWIGLSRATPNDPWTWSSGEPFSYANWRPSGVGFPWSEPTGETAGVFYVNDPSVPLGYWADTYPAGSEPFNAIYESVPEPLAGAMLGISALATVVMLRRRVGKAT
jgi:hypothetical protein